MGQISFAPVFSGGDGDLYITCADISITLHFDQGNSGAQTMTLGYGHQIISFQGAAPNGPGGNIALAITGDLPAEIDINFPSGYIPPHSQMLYVNA